MSIIENNSNSRTVILAGEKRNYVGCKLPFMPRLSIPVPRSLVRAHVMAWSVVIRQACATSREHCDKMPSHINCQNSNLLRKLHFDMTLEIETKAIVGVLSINRPCRNFLSLGANLILATMSLPIFSFTLYQQPTKSPRVESSWFHASSGGRSFLEVSTAKIETAKENRHVIRVDDVFLHNCRSIV